MNKDLAFKYIGFAAIGFLLVGLLGWYFFISRETASLSANDEARGFDISVPSFTGSRGSTAENIASGFGMAPDAPAEEEPGETARPDRLWHVNLTPVAGAGFISTGSSTVLRFVERSTGHVFDADPETGVVTRRTNRLIPKVYEASVGPGDTVIARTIATDGTRETFVGSFGTTTVDGFFPLTGTNLGQDIRDIAFDSKGVVFLAANAGGGSRLIRADIDGSEPKEIRQFGAGDFNLDLLTDGRIVLVEKPASGVPGHAYEYGKTFSSLARRVPGLTLTAHASSSAVLIGSDTGYSLLLSVRATKDASPLQLDIQTTADKCTWSPGSSLTAYCAVPQTPPSPRFLSNWHRGTVHTTDSWHVVEAAAGTSDPFYEMRVDDAIDVEHPIVDPKGEYIAFMNARDKSLWILRIIE